MSPGSKLATWLGHRIGTPTTNDYIDRIMRTGDVKVALDIGCGITSHLSRLQPLCKTVTFTLCSHWFGIWRDNNAASEIPN